MSPLSPVQALGLWSPGVATARTPRGPKRMKGWRRKSSALSGGARAQRPPTSVLHCAMAASSGG